MIEKLSGEVHVLEKALKASQHKGKRHNKKHPTPSPTHPSAISPSTSPPPSQPPPPNPNDTIPPNPSPRYHSTSDLLSPKSEVLAVSGTVEEPQQSRQDPAPYLPQPSDDPSLESTKL